MLVLNPSVPLTCTHTTVTALLENICFFCLLRLLLRWRGEKTPTYPSCVKSWGWYVVMKYVFVYCSGHVRLIMFLMSFFPCCLKLEARKCIMWLVFAAGFDAVEHTQQCVPVMCPWYVNAFSVAAPGGRFSSPGMQSWVLQGNLLPWTLTSGCWLLSPGTVQFWHKSMDAAQAYRHPVPIGSTMCP